MNPLASPLLNLARAWPIPIRTKKPSSRPRRSCSEAMDRGQFAQSHELGVLLSLCAMLGALALRPRQPRATSRSTPPASSPVSLSTPVHTDTVVLQISEAMQTSGRALAPILCACVAAALLSGGLQSGFRCRPMRSDSSSSVWSPMLDSAGSSTSRCSCAAASTCSSSSRSEPRFISVSRGLIYDPLFSAPVEVAYLGQFLTSATILFLTRLIFALGIVTAISYGYEKFKTARDDDDARRR